MNFDEGEVYSVVWIKSKNLGVETFNKYSPLADLCQNKGEIKPNGITRYDSSSRIWVLNHKPSDLYNEALSEAIHLLTMHMDAISRLRELDPEIEISAELIFIYKGFSLGGPISPEHLGFITENRILFSVSAST